MAQRLLSGFLQTIGGNTQRVAKAFSSFKLG